MAGARHELEAMARAAGGTGALLTGRDGMLIEATMERQRAEALSALVAASFGAAGELGAELPELAMPEELVIEADKGTIYVTPAGPARLLALLSGPSGNLGVIRLEMRQAAARLSDDNDQDPAGAVSDALT